MKEVTMIFYALLFSSATSYSQTLCGSDSLHQSLLSTDKAYKLKSEQFESLWQKQSTQYKKQSGSMTRVIPVVFHILHDNGPENIPDSLIYQQLDILNESFRKLPGTPGDGSGVDTEIEFCLASIDPAGNPTTGITRTQTPCTDLFAAGCVGTIIPQSIIMWGDSTRVYLNIWIRKNFGYIGLGGPGPFQIQVRYDAVGRNSAWNGLVAVHEAGHWLNIMHTFQGGCGTNDCLTSGDFVCDTPPMSSGGSCPSGPNTCTNDVPDLPDQPENYMGYSLGCANMFTEGQKARMYTLLDNPNAYHNYMTSYENLQNTGCGPCSVPPCIPLPNFGVTKTLVSKGDSLTFTDLSYNEPTSWNWSFPGGTPSSSTSENPIVQYDTVGTFDATLIVTNAAGSDTISKSNYITVVSQTWSSLGLGLAGDIGGVADLEEFQGNLYVAGYFDVAGGDSINRIAMWDGVQWYDLNGGIDGVDTFYNGLVYDLLEYNNKLYVCGNFQEAGNVSVTSIAKWDGNQWMSVGSGLDSTVGIEKMVEFNNELYISVEDSISNTIKKLDGSTWTTVATLNSFCWDLTVYENNLFIGGSFDTLNGSPISKGIAKYDGASWSGVGSGLFGPIWPNGFISEMVVYDSMLYISGRFTTVDGVNAFHMARYDGFTWSPVGSGLDHSASTFIGYATSMELWNNKLYVGGPFDLAGGKSANYIASWDGTSWAPVGTGMNWRVEALKVWNNDLYAGGGFKVAGKDSIEYIAKWGCPNLYVAFTQSVDTVDLAVSGDVFFTDQGTNAINWFWDFGDGGTATVPNPVHTYLQEGIYTVTLTTTNDTCANSAVSTVVVKWDCFPLMNVNYSQSTDTVNLVVSNDVSFNINPDILSDSILWDFGDGITDTTKNPSHIYAAAGTYTVTLSAYTDTCYIIATSTVVVVDISVVKDINSNQYVHIYPNPNTGQFTLQMYLQEQTRLSIKLYHFTGQLIYSEEISNVSGKYTQQMDLSGYRKGIYYVQLKTERGLVTKKVISQ